MRAAGLWVAIALACVSCGPSAGEVKRARLAVYKAPGVQIFDLALQETQGVYAIGAVEPEKRKFATQPQWYSQEGGRQSGTDEGNGEYVRTRDRSVQVWFVVQVMDLHNGKVAVEITPRTFQLIAGSPQPRELTPEDPNLPPWVKGRVDSLALAIYHRARNFATMP